MDSLNGASSSKGIRPAAVPEKKKMKRGRTDGHLSKEEYEVSSMQEEHHNTTHVENYLLSNNIFLIY